MARKKRHWEEILEEDPAAGLLNLFDVWIAFAVALLLAMASFMNLPEIKMKRAEAAAQQKSNAPDLESLKKENVKMERYRETRQELRGEGERLGTAYRLKSGEVVYVPDGIR